ncbi:MAG: hypothetical protein Q8S75_08545 [Nitrospirota bacterium]|nr:hypothetical protein [Nitrospirota bacterium]
MLDLAGLSDTQRRIQSPALHQHAYALLHAFRQVGPRVVFSLKRKDLGHPLKGMTDLSNQETVQYREPGEENIFH